MADPQVVQDLKLISGILDETVDDFLTAYAATGEDLDDVTFAFAQAMVRKFGEENWQLAVLFAVAVRRLAV